MFAQRLAGGKNRVWFFYPIPYSTYLAAVLYLNFIISINSIRLDGFYDYA